jgi:DNA excision repair protein ERCC-8
VASGGSDGRIALWDIRAARSCLFYLDYEKTVSSKNAGQHTDRSVAHNGPVVGLTFTPDGNQIVSLAKDNRLQLWNASSGLNTITNYGKVPLNSAVAEASLQLSCTDNCLERYVFVPSNCNLLMYNVQAGSLRATYKGHFEAVNCCVYSPGLSEVYSGAKDRNVLIWTPEKQVGVDKVAGERSAYSMMSSTGRSERSAGVKRSRDNWSDDDED